MRHRVLRVLVLSGLMCILLAASACGAKDVKRSSPEAGLHAFPANYRVWRRLTAEPRFVFSNERKVAWTLYANDVAMSRQPGSPFPPGSVLVKEERLVAQDPSGRDVVRAVFRVSAMFKVTPDKPSKDGWIYKAFDPLKKSELPLDQYDPNGCYFCHIKARNNDYVFDWNR